MWLQHITVHEPDDSMIECAIKAMRAVIPTPEEEAEEAAKSGEIIKRCSGKGHHFCLYKKVWGIGEEVSEEGEDPFP